MDLDENGNPIEVDDNLNLPPEDDNLDPGNEPSGDNDGDNDTPEDMTLAERLESELSDMRPEDGEDGEGEEKPAEPAADGTPGDDDPKPAEGEGETTGEQKPAEGEKTPDPDADPDDELAEGMKERTRERFNEIRDENKNLKGQIEGFQEGSQELHNVILESTATSQQLAGALQIFKSINSGDAAEADKILPEIKMLYDAIAQTAGKPTMGGDVLEQFPDLQKAVKDLDISQGNAEELAGLRVQSNQNQMRLDQTNQNTAVQQQTAGAGQQAAADIKTWEDSLLSSDPDYKLLQPKLVAAFGDVRATVHPSQWLTAMQAKYQDMHSGMVLANKTQQNNSPQTIRPTNSGAKTKVDTSKMSMEDVMKNSLANMRG